MSGSNTPSITAQISFTETGMTISYSVYVPPGCSPGTFTAQDIRRCSMCFINAAMCNQNLSPGGAVVTNPA
jgi:hypothetical protein